LEFDGSHDFAQRLGQRRLNRTQLRFGLIHLADGQEQCGQIYLLGVGSGRVSIWITGHSGQQIAGTIRFE